MFEEFKKFALKGNVLDLAVAVIIGAAFGKIITSFVNDILMPPIGQLMGGMDFSNLFYVLDGGSYETLQEAIDAGAATINYGLFANTVIDFLIVAFSIFMVVKAFNKLKKKEEKKPEKKGPTQEELLAEIRDLLKKKK